MRTRMWSQLNKIRPNSNTTTPVSTPPESPMVSRKVTQSRSSDQLVIKQKSPSHAIIKYKESAPLLKPVEDLILASNKDDSLDNCLAEVNATQKPVKPVVSSDVMAPGTKPGDYILTPQFEDEEDVEENIDAVEVKFSNSQVSVKAVNNCMSQEQIDVWAHLLIDHKSVTTLDRIGLTHYIKNRGDVGRLEGAVFKFAALEADASYITVASEIAGQVEELFHDAF